MTAEYVVRLGSSDGSTKFRLVLDESEAATLERLAHASEQMSQYGWHPTLTLEPYDASDYDPDYDPAPEVAPWVLS